MLPVTPTRVHKIRLVPTPEQEDYFRNACGVARVAYNWALEAWKFQYEIHSIDPDMPLPNWMSISRELNAIKHEKYPWMAKVTKNAPQQAIKNLGLAFQHFFRRVKLGQKPGYPVFKRKGIRDSFRADSGEGAPVNGRSVRLPIRRASSAHSVVNNTPR